VITFTRLKYLSFTHSAIYFTLLLLWATDQPRQALGWAHGVGWIGMSLLCIYAVRRRIIPLWLGVMVAVVGGLGPFAGSIAFVVEERRRAGQESGLERGMV
jgi:hypothetical protein